MFKYGRTKGTRAPKSTTEYVKKSSARARAATAKSRQPTTFRTRTVARPAIGYQRGHLPFPAGGYMAKLPYSDENYISANGSSGTASVAQYRLNSIYDPDLTGVGKQPLQRDTLTAIYSTYLVYGAKIRITFTNPSSDGMYVGYRVSSAYNTVTSSGMSISRFKELTNQELAPINNTGQQSKTFTMYCPISNLYGVTPLQYKSNYVVYGASSAANPAIDALLDIVVFSTNSGVTDTIRYTVEIVYYTQFSGYVTPPQS